MKPTRRTLLLGTTAAAGSLWAGSALWSALRADESGAGNPLHIPPLLDARAAANTSAARLV